MDLHDKLHQFARDFMALRPETRQDLSLDEWILEYHSQLSDIEVATGWAIYKFVCARDV